MRIGMMIGRQVMRNAGEVIRMARAEMSAFSRPFIEVIVPAINAGLLSARRAADVLDVPIDDLARLAAAHDVNLAVAP
jgi:hypothetical protein